MWKVLQGTQKAFAARNCGFPQNVSPKPAVATPANSEQTELRKSESQKSLERQSGPAPYEGNVQSHSDKKCVVRNLEGFAGRNRSQLAHWAPYWKDGKSGNASNREKKWNHKFGREGQKAGDGWGRFCPEHIGLCRGEDWRFFEVIGWGTIVILGAQIGDLCHKMHRIHSDQNEFCLHSWFKKISVLEFWQPSGQSIKRMQPSSTHYEEPSRCDSAASDALIGSDTIRREFEEDSESKDQTSAHDICSLFEQLRGQSVIENDLLKLDAAFENCNFLECDEITGSSKAIMQLNSNIRDQLIHCIRNQSKVIIKGQSEFSLFSTLLRNLITNKGAQTSPELNWLLPCKSGVANFPVDVYKDRWITSLKCSKITAVSTSSSTPEGFQEPDCLTAAGRKSEEWQMGDEPIEVKNSDLFCPSSGFKESENCKWTNATKNNPRDDVQRRPGGIASSSGERLCFQGPEFLQAVGKPAAEVCLEDLSGESHQKHEVWRGTDYLVTNSGNAQISRKVDCRFLPVDTRNSESWKAGNVLETSSEITEVWPEPDGLVDEDFAVGMHRIVRAYRALSDNATAVCLANQGDVEAAVQIWERLVADLDPCYGAEEGWTKAMFNLGLCYEHGYGSLSKDENKAVDCYQIAADLGHGKSAFNLSMILIGENEVKHERKIFRLLSLAAEQGLAKAERELGILYASRGKNEEKAFQLFMSAAKKMDAHACFNVALCFEHGWGVSPDSSMALQYYRKAVVGGNVIAQCNLANCYEKGLLGCQVDKRKALDLYESAAKGGLSEAAQCSSRLRAEISLHSKKLNGEMSHDKDKIATYDNKLKWNELQMKPSYSGSFSRLLSTGSDELHASSSEAGGQMSHTDKSSEDFILNSGFFLGGFSSDENDSESESSAIKYRRVDSDDFIKFEDDSNEDDVVRAIAKRSY